MSARMLDGRVAAAGVMAELRDQMHTLVSEPGLASVVVGDDPASKIYVERKLKACRDLGIYAAHHPLPARTTEAELLSLIDSLNRNNRIHGILVQLPLPSHIDADSVIRAISPDKDVDCFHPYNLGLLLSAKRWEDMSALTFLPCTPAGVVALLDWGHVSCEGARVVMIGRSNIVGKPLALMLLAKQATVSICHSRTKDLPTVCAQADILIAAIGSAAFVTKEFVKPGAVVIDVGMNRTAAGLKGDVDYADVSPCVSAITPVPGGVGPMTIAMLMKNTLRAAQL